MTPEQIKQIYNYLENRKENQFSEMVLKKLKSCKSDGEKTYYIQKTINPVILSKIFKGELE
jgi:hypothetical protein